MGLPIFSSGERCNDNPFLTFGNDTISRPIAILVEAFRRGHWKISMQLRDQNGTGELLQGQPGALTCNGIPKPSYYGYLLLSRIRGSIAAVGENFCVIRSGETPCRHFIIAFHSNAQILAMCDRNTSVYQAKKILDEFQDEADFSFHLELCPGSYGIVTYHLDSTHDIFSYFSALHFCNKTQIWKDFSDFLPLTPLSDLYREETEGPLEINLSFQGAGIQLAVISPIG